MPHIAKGWASRNIICEKLIVPQYAELAESTSNCDVCRTKTGDRKPCRPPSQFSLESPAHEAFQIITRRRSSTRFVTMRECGLKVSVCTVILLHVYAIFLAGGIISSQRGGRHRSENAPQSESLQRW